MRLRLVSAVCDALDDNCSQVRGQSVAGFQAPKPALLAYFRLLTIPPLWLLFALSGRGSQARPRPMAEEQCVQILRRMVKG